MSAIIYSASSGDCSVSIPIVTIVDKKYVITGPEYKKGISGCVKFEDFDPPILEHEPKKYSCNSRCLDLYEALKDNFQYYGDLNESHLLGCLALYVWVAKKCEIKHLIPDVLIGLVEVSVDFGDIPVYVAKFLNDPAQKVEKIREWYFVQLGMQADFKDLVVDPDVGKILITSYIPDIIKYSMIKSDEQFNKLVVALAQTIEHNAKMLNFLHGNVHIGHVTIDGKLIDFGDSFVFYDKEYAHAYLEKYIPNKKKKALSKYKVQDIDVGAACTLVELRNFFQSIIDNSQKIPNLARFKKASLEYSAWITEMLDKYFDDFELSIFTMVRTTDEFAIMFGGFDVPPEPSEIPGKFPTQFFLEEFGLLEKERPNS